MRFRSLPLLATSALIVWSVAQAAFNGTQNSSAIIFPMSTDDEFSFVLTETLALAQTEGSATSEVLRIASQVLPGNFSSWYDEFTFMADAMQNLSQVATTATSRRQALFRASSYYRLAPFFLTGNASDQRLYANWDKAIGYFHTAISLLHPSYASAENFTLKASSPSVGNFSIPGYFFKPNSGNSTAVKRQPTVIVGNGYDAPQEDSYHALAQQILDRGWNLITYEGPGQPTVRRRQNLGFIPDWWSVVSPVVTHALSRPEVEPSNLALVGISFGGILAPLAASREPRLKAVLSIDGATDFQAAVLGAYPPQLSQLFKSGNRTGFDGYVAAVNALASTPTVAKWVTGQGLWSFNTRPYYDWVAALGNFTLTQERVDDIGAWPWIGKGEDDQYFPGQESRLAGFYNASGRHNATYKVFTNVLGAGQHCQLGAESQLGQAAFDWLDGIFKMSSNSTY